MTGLYLVFTGSFSSSQHSLSTSETAQQAYDHIGSAEGRLSPIFPVVVDSAVRDPLEGARFVALLCPLRAFEFIGRQPQNVQRKIWFSLGLASVIIFAKEESDFTELLAKEREHLSAYEVWRIEESQSILVHDSWVRPVSFDPPRLIYPEHLFKDTLRLIDEIQGNLHEAGRVGAIFMPEEVPKFQKLAEATNEIIRELEFHPTGSDPPKQFASRSLRKDP